MNCPKGLKPGMALNPGICPKPGNPGIAPPGAAPKKGAEKGLPGEAAAACAQASVDFWNISRQYSKGLAAFSCVVIAYSLILEYASP